MIYNIDKTSLVKKVVSNGLPPAEGPRVMLCGFYLPVGAGNSIEIDSNSLIDNAFPFGNLQCLFIDTTGVSNSAFVRFELFSVPNLFGASVKYDISVQKLTQGFYPVFAPGNWKIAVTWLGAIGAGPVVLGLMNYHEAAAQWVSGS